MSAFAWWLAADSGPRVSLAAAGNVDALNIDPADATAAFSLESDGDIVATENGIASDLGDWISPKVGMGNYDVKATLLSGTLTAGTTGSNLNLGTTRSWSRAQTSVGSSSAQIRLDITVTGTTTPVLATATITLSAQVD